MNQEANLVRCPLCGSLNLQAVYDDRANKNLTKSSLRFGMIGLLVSLIKNRNITSTFWECQSCGHKFAMK